MERVETLCNLLAEKIRKNASADELLQTVRMLESELLHLKSVASPGTPHSSAAPAVSISKPYIKEEEPVILAAAPEMKSPEPPKEEKRIVEVLQIDEAEIEAELEEIKKHAEERNKMSVQNKPVISFDPVDDIPTLAGRTPAPPTPAPVPAQKKEIHEILPVNNAPSINETIKKPQSEIADTLQDAPVKDLKKAIGINDRYRYINELFRGDEAMYERSIKTINGFAIFPEAEYWIRRELKLKLGWNDKNETVMQFDQLVKRRFL